MPARLKGPVYTDETAYKLVFDLWVSGLRLSVPDGDRGTLNVGARVRGMSPKALLDNCGLAQWVRDLKPALLRYCTWRESEVTYRVACMVGRAQTKQDVAFFRTAPREEIAERSIKTGAAKDTQPDNPSAHHCFSCGMPLGEDREPRGGDRDVTHARCSLCAEAAKRAVEQVGRLREAQRGRLRLPVEPESACVCGMPVYVFDSQGTPYCEAHENWSDQGV